MTPPATAAAPSKPYPAAAVSKVITDALRQQRRSRRTKYEIALDALLRVADDFDGSDGVAIEDALAALRGRIDTDEIGVTDV